MCRSADQESLRLKSPKHINEALIFKLIWDFMTFKEKWVFVCRSRYNYNKSPCMYHINSLIWLGIKCHLNLPLEGTRWVVGRWDKINYQNDDLLGEPLSEILEIPCANRKQFSTKVENLIE